MNEDTAQESLTSQENEAQEVDLRVENALKSTSLYLEKLESEIKLGFRTTTFNEKEYRIYLPSIKNDNELTKFKSSLMSNLLKDKSIMLKDEVLKNLKEREIWDKQKEKEEKKLKDRLARCMSDIYLEKNSSVRNETLIRELFEEKVSLELDLVLLAGTKDSLLANTLENIIEVETQKYKMCLCIKDADNIQVWNNIEELENSDKALVNSLGVEAVYFWSGVDPAMFDVALDN